MDIPEFFKTLALLYRHAGYDALLYAIKIVKMDCFYDTMSKIKT